MAKKNDHAMRVDTIDGRDYLAALREHGRIVTRTPVESDRDEALPPGVTHVLIDDGKAAPLLVEKRKSFI